MPEITVDTLLKIAQVSKKTQKISKLVLFLGRSSGQLIDNAKHCYLESIRGNYAFKSILYTKYSQSAFGLTANNVVHK